MGARLALTGVERGDEVWVSDLTFIATATADVAGAGLQLGLYDQVSGARITYCSRGTSCSTTVTKSLAGFRSIVASVGGPSDTLVHVAAPYPLRAGGHAYLVARAVIVVEAARNVGSEDPVLDCQVLEMKRLKDHVGHRCLGGPQGRGRFTNT